MNRYQEYIILFSLLISVVLYIILAATMKDMTGCPYRIDLMMIFNCMPYALTSFCAVIMAVTENPTQNESDIGPVRRALKGLINVGSILLIWLSLSFFSSIPVLFLFTNYCPDQAVGPTVGIYWGTAIGGCITSGYLISNRVIDLVKRRKFSEHSISTNRLKTLVNSVKLVEYKKNKDLNSGIKQKSKLEIIRDQLTEQEALKDFLKSYNKAAQNLTPFQEIEILYLILFMSSRLNPLNLNPNLSEPKEQLGNPVMASLSLTGQIHSDPQIHVKNCAICSIRLDYYSMACSDCDAMFHLRCLTARLSYHPTCSCCKSKFRIHLHQLIQLKA